MCGCRTCVDEIQITAATISEGHFAAEGVGEAAGYLTGSQTGAEEEHHFGEGGLGGDVVAGNHAGFIQEAAGVVAFLVHASVDALRNVHYYDSFVDGFLYGFVEPVGCGCVPCTIGLQDYALHSGGVQLLAQSRFRHPGIYIDDDDVGRQTFVHFEPAFFAHSP